MKEETKEKEENQAEMERAFLDLQDLLDLQDKSSIRTKAVLIPWWAPLDLREEQEFPVRLDSLAQLDLRVTVETLVCPDTVTRGRKENRGSWSVLMEVSSDWKDSLDRRVTEALWDPPDLLVRMGLRASKERSGCPGARVVLE